MSRKFLAFFITIFIIITLSLIGVGITYVLRVTNIDKNVKNFIEKVDVVSYTTVSTIVSSPVSDLDLIPDKVTEIDQNTSELSSEVLQLSFSYQNSSGNYAVMTTKKGNRISIKSAAQSEEEAQFIELFAKKENETFQEAIERIYLDGVPENFCYFSPIENEYNFTNKNFTLGTIRSGVGVRPEQCPGPYTENTTSGPRFFVYDSSFPDRFAFIYVGESFVAGRTPTQSWFESLQFLKN
ncbi:MAG: hypothetical protein IAE91_09835 [Ignavibacteriaceae bacterium]|nr:hypothetical protein [Ignavibacteriaceae bacterium]